MRGEQGHEGDLSNTLGLARNPRNTYGVSGFQGNTLLYYSLVSQEETEDHGVSRAR